MKISITITAIVFLSLMYLIGKMYCELNSRIEKIEEKLEKDISEYPEAKYTKWYLVDILKILKGENDGSNR